MSPAKKTVWIVFFSPHKAEDNRVEEREYVGVALEGLSHLLIYKDSEGRLLATSNRFYDDRQVALNELSANLDLHLRNRKKNHKADGAYIKGVEVRLKELDVERKEE